MAHTTVARIKFLQKTRIRTATIKVRKNSTVTSLKNNTLKNREVCHQIKDLLKWKEKRIYGYRWVVETVFSPIKKMFVGEYVSTTRFQNMAKEVMKMSLYNFFRGLA